MIQTYPPIHWTALLCSSSAKDGYVSKSAYLPFIPNPFEQKKGSLVLKVFCVEHVEVVPENNHMARHSLYWGAPLLLPSILARHNTKQ